MMKRKCLYRAGAAPALEYAGTYLRRRGCALADAPGPEVTHLLLPVPSLNPAGHLPGGTALETVLETLPGDVVILGGNLPEDLAERYRTVDFLRDPLYLARNAAITAQCAIRMAGARLPRVWEGCPVLILGWGRIGKFLASYLKALGAEVAVAARKETDRALLRAMGFRAEDTEGIGEYLPHFRVVFNTIPAPVVTSEQTAACHPDTILMDLASSPGMDGGAVIRARGLPGKRAPESSGVLIGRTAMGVLIAREAAQ